MAVATRTRVESLEASAYTVPTDRPESDGTMEWDSTTIVVVEASAGGQTGIGWTYGPSAITALVERLQGAVCGHDPLDIPAAWARMVGQSRNSGPWGLAMYAVSAVDVALWDLKARLLGVAVANLLGRRREEVAIYGSGGFCSYPDDVLAEQLGGWARDGIPRVKLKVGRDPDRDPHRVAVARSAVGDEVELMVDANGAWSPEFAVAMAHVFAEQDVRWIEEPVPSDDLAGLRAVRSRVPPGMAVAAGEYATDAYGFQRLLEADAVDVLQADPTRCGGYTGMLQADAIAFAHNRALSAHCAPNLSVHAMAAAQRGRHIEYFHDHDRIERMFFDGVLDPDCGVLRPDPERPGHGLTFRREEAERYRA